MTPAAMNRKGRAPLCWSGSSTNAGRPRFPVLLLAPVTTFKGQPWVAVAPDLIPCAESWGGWTAWP